jgi:hypothetical protein
MEDIVCLVNATVMHEPAIVIQAFVTTVSTLPLATIAISVSKAITEMLLLALRTIVLFVLVLCLLIPITLQLVVKFLMMAIAFTVFVKKDMRVIYTIYAIFLCKINLPINYFKQVTNVNIVRMAIMETLKFLERFVNHANAVETLIRICQELAIVLLVNAGYV